MDDLVKWLFEQIEHDETTSAEQGETHTLACIARAPYEWDHQCRCGFANRVPVECSTKRRITTAMQAQADRGHMMDAEYVLRLLALPYAGREGYREEWKP